MPDQLDERIERALRAEVDEMPMAVVPTMVEERLHHAAGGGLGLPLMGAAVATVLAALAVIASADRWAPPEPAGTTQVTMVRSDEPIAPLDATAPAACLLVERDASGSVSTWWYSPGDPADCATTNSSLVEVGGTVSASGEHGDVYSLRFLVQLTTGDLDFVEIGTTVTFPQGGEPYFTTPDGPVSATVLDRIEVPTAFGVTETPLPTPVAATRPPSAAPVAMDCSTTQPVRAPEEIGDQLFGWGSAYGNDDLWVGGLGREGIIMVRDAVQADDGSIGWKLGWWRNVRGTLEISGRRLDADAPPLEAGAPDGYGSIGFQASGVAFPTDGCWEITGRVGEAELTFVTLVLDAEAEVDRLFVDTRRCTVTLAGVDLALTYPASWSASEATDEHPGCIWFGPESIVADESGSSPPEAAITFGAVGGPEEPRSPSQIVVGLRSVMVGGMPASRVELADEDTELVRLTYWIAAGTDPDSGPTIVATTTTDAAGHYELNKAVLDQMMSVLAVEE